MTADGTTPPVILPKRFLTKLEACAIYGCSVDYLDRQSAQSLPRNRRGTRMVMFDVRDLEAHFGRFREADGAAIPTNVAAMLYLPPAA